MQPHDKIITDTITECIEKYTEYADLPNISDTDFLLANLLIVVHELRRDLFPLIDGKHRRQE